MGSRRDKQRYVRIEYDGSYCIVEQHEAKDMIELGDEESYIVTDAWMTKAEFEALPEFIGF